MLSSKKKLFTHLYISNNLNDAYLQIELDQPINYAQYFILSKLIHSSIIKFQHNTFLSCTSACSLFIMHSINGTENIVQVVLSSYSELKQMLTDIKTVACKRAKTLTDYHSNSATELEIVFIDALADTDDRFTQTSIKQVKSSLSRRINTYQGRYSRDPYSFISTAFDLVQYYYSVFRQKWQLRARSLLYPTTTPDTTFQDYKDSMEIATNSDTLQNQTQVAISNFLDSCLKTQ
jgi:hypothetical protein